MLLRLRRLLKWSVLGLIAVALLFASKDALRLNPAQEAAAPYQYDLVEWHVANSLSKWVHRATRALPWNSQSREDRQLQVREYFRLGAESSRLMSELRRAASQSGKDAASKREGLEAKLQQVRERREGLRNDVEETLEAHIGAVVAEAGLGSWGKLTFPPVDIRLTEPPKVLVTSPRDRILRTHDVLLTPDVKVTQIEELEDKLFKDSDLSALVLDIGGLATYPASLPNSQPLLSTLRSSAHEWLHHYLFFRPLGQNMFRDRNIQSLNETLAEMAGREIGDRAFDTLSGSPSEPHAAEPTTQLDAAQDEGEFDFDREMRKTRRRVDELLASGQIDEAEAYMEERRGFFLENGRYIRRLNQAYFAFHGTYAESPASVSPIGGQLRQFRKLVPDLGTFIRSISGVSSYQQFVDRLEELRTQSQPHSLRPQAPYHGLHGAPRNVLI